MIGEIEQAFIVQGIVGAMLEAGATRVVNNRYSHRATVWAARRRGSKARPASTETTETMVEGEWANGAVCTVPVHPEGIGHAGVVKPMTGESSNYPDENVSDVFDPQEWEHAIRYAAGLVER